MPETSKYSAAVASERVGMMAHAVDRNTEMSGGSVNER